MAEEYARTVARVAAGQLAELAGYEAVQESAVEILSDLLLRYLDEVATGAHSYAEVATRSDVNVHDIVMSIDDLGTSVEELKAYAESLSSEDNTFAHALAPFPVRRPARVMPTFEDKGEQPPPHVPSFLPAFPDQHTFEHTPTFPGHETVPQKQTEVVQQQRRAAEKALVQLHKRAKLSSKAAQDRDAAAGPAAAAASDQAATNPFLAPSHFEISTEEEQQQQQRLSNAEPGAAAAAAAGSGPAGAALSNGSHVPPSDQELLESCPHHVVFDRDLVIRQLGPALETVLPWVQPHGNKLTDAFRVVHPAVSQGAEQQLHAGFFTSNPFRSFVLQAQQGPAAADGQQQEQELHGMELQGPVLCACLRLKRAPLPGVPQAAAAGLAAAAAGMLSDPEDVLVLLARPRTSTSEDLEVRDREAEAQLRQQQRAAGAAAGGSKHAVAPELAEAAFRVLLSTEGAEREMSWKCSSNFEGSGGPLKQTFAAGFSQDWATSTRRSALALASRRQQEDAYKDTQHKGKA